MAYNSKQDDWVTIRATKFNKINQNKFNKNKFNSKNNTKEIVPKLIEMYKNNDDIANAFNDELVKTNDINMQEKLIEIMCSYHFHEILNNPNIFKKIQF